MNTDVNTNYQNAAVPAGIAPSFPVLLTTIGAIAIGLAINYFVCKFAVRSELKRNRGR